MKLQGCLISDMEKIQTEYYVLTNEFQRKAENSYKERDYKRYRAKAEAYYKCYEKMQEVLKFVNNL